VSVLLRDASGFEGLLRVAVYLGPHDLSIAQGEDNSLFKFRRHPAARSQTPLAAYGDHLIPVVEQLVELDLPLLERKRLEPVLLKECPDLVIAAIDAEPGMSLGEKSNTMSGDQMPALITASGPPWLNTS
jgi:hypothetical protein